MRQLLVTPVAPAGLVIGGVLGMAGTFVPSAAVRGLLWGLDGIALVVATTLLAVHHLRRGHEVVAAGFLVFSAGETLIVAGAALDFSASASLFAAGAGLWAASLLLVSTPAVMPLWLRGVAAVAALLFALVATQMFVGRSLTPLSRPLPFFAYPFLVITLFGWAWVHSGSTRLARVSRNNRGTMNPAEALALLDQDLASFREEPYAGLVDRISAGPINYERVAPSQVTYQIEIQVFWEHRPGGNILVIGAIDDGGWRSSFRPLTRDFMKAPDGSFVGE